MKIAKQSVILTLFILSILLVSLVTVPITYAWDAPHQHPNMTEYCGNHMDIAGSNLTNLAQGSIDADEFDVAQPSEVDPAFLAILYAYYPDGVNIIKKWDSYHTSIYHGFMHSYLVDIYGVEPMIVAYESYNNNAPENTKKKAEQARSSFKNGDYQDGYEELGYAMHYIQDMSNPMHTTVDGLLPYDSIYEDETASPWKSYHGAIENYVFYNYGDPCSNYDGKKGQDIKGYNKSVMYAPEDYYYVADPEVATKDMACLSYLVSQYEVEVLNDNKNNWENDLGIIEGTNLLLSEQQKYSMGLVDYVFRPENA